MVMKFGDDRNDVLLKDNKVGFCTALSRVSSMVTRAICQERHTCSPQDCMLSAVFGSHMANDKSRYLPGGKIRACAEPKRLIQLRRYLHDVGDDSRVISFE
jgi:hypothetical protein